MASLLAILDGHRRTLRLPSGPMAALVPAAFAWIAWVVTHPKRDTVQAVLEMAFFLLVGGMILRNLWKARTRDDLPAGTTRALGWLLTGWIVLLLALCYVLVREVLLRAWLGPPGVGLADFLFMGSYPPMILGLLHWPRGGAQRQGPWRILLDCAVFIFGVGLPLWVFAIQPFLGHGSAVETLVSIAFPGLAFTGVVAADFVLLRGLPMPSRTAFHLLLTGTLLIWLSDLVFTLGITQEMKVPFLFRLANQVNLVAFLLVLAGSRQLRRDPVPPRAAPTAAFSPIPLLALVIVALWMARMVAVTPHSGQTLQGVLAGTTIVFLVLLLRESLAAQESLQHARQATLHAVRARFEALVQHSEELVLVVDRSDRLTFASPAASRLFGEPAEALEGRPLAGFVHREDLPALRGFLDTFRLDPHARPVQEWRMRDADGAWRVFETCGSDLLRDPDVEGVVLNARDISERRRLEERMRQVTKMEALGRLAGGVAHDINNMLSAILGNVELARMALPDGPTLLGKLESIQDATGRGAKLTGRLLAFTRMESASLEVVDARHLLDGVLPLIEGLAGDRIQLEVDIATDAGAIRVNPGELEQAVLNAAINARDAMPEGGRLVIRVWNAELSERDQVHFLAPEPGPCVVLEIADSGLGMDPEVQSHLFEPFFTTKERGKGTGLGLVGIYGAIRSAHGGIRVHSEGGKGTTFQFWLPRVALGPAVAAEPVTAATPTGGETLLLVEDDPNVREATLEILASLGYHVYEAAGGEEARRVLSTIPGPLHLLITDVMMPGESGPRLAASLESGLPGLKSLFISGYTADELGSYGLADPGPRLLEKPFTRDQLGRRIRLLLDGGPNLD